MANDALEGTRVPSLTDLNLLARLDSNAKSETLLAEAKVSRHLYALKVYGKDFLIENDETQTIDVEKKVSYIAKREGHPFLTRVHSTFQTETRVFFVMGFLQGGSLMHHIQEGMDLLYD